jgi:hypothetical protein
MQRIALTALQMWITNNHLKDQGQGQRPSEGRYAKENRKRLDTDTIWALRTEKALL